MKYFKIFALFFLAFMFNQCGEPCQDISCQNNGTCLDGICNCPDGFEGDNCEINLNQKLKRFSQSGLLIAEYEYNSENKLSKRTTYDTDSNISNESVFTIRGDTIIETIFLHGLNSTYENKYFQESALNFVKNSYFIGENATNFSSKITYKFNTACGMSEQINFNAFETQQTSSNWVYNENNCNYFVTYLNQDETIHASINTVVLDKPSPLPTVFDYFNLERFKLIDSSNFFSHLQDINGVFSPGASYIAEYEFNNNGFPTKEIRKYLNNNEIIFTYEYYE